MHTTETTPTAYKVPATEKVRTSAAIPGLTYEIRPNFDGVGCYVVFKYGAAFDGYTIRPGVAQWADTSDRKAMPGKVYDYCQKVALAMAAKLDAIREVAA